jgi:NAD(P)-dependent dehydrogenase (short-subunit alcohol dehydrogenase family)
MKFTHFPATINRNDLNSTFNTNVNSAHMVTSAFLPLLRKGTRKRVVNLSVYLHYRLIQPLSQPECREENISECNTNVKQVHHNGLNY